MSDLVHHLVLVGLYALGRRDRVERQLLLDGVGGVGPHPVLEVILGGPGELVVLPWLHPLRPEAPLEAPQHLLYLLVHHDVRDLDLGLFRRSVEHAGAELALDALLLGGLELLPNGGAQLLEGLDLARLLGELVVEGRELALLDLLEVHPEKDRLAPQGLFGVIQREGDPELLALAGLHAEELSFEVRQELAAPDLQHVVLGLGARQGSAGHPLAPEVDDYEVALSDRAILDRREGGELAAHLLELLLDLLVGYLDLFSGHLDTPVTAERCLGANGDRGGELEALLLVERLVEVDLGGVYGPEVGLDDRLAVPGRQLLLERLVVDVVAPEVVLDHAPRCLAWPETRHPHLPPEFPDLGLDANPHRLGGHLDVEPDPVVLELRYVRRHALQFRRRGEVREAGIEPARPKALDPKSSVSTIPPLSLIAMEVRARL